MSVRGGGGGGGSAWLKGAEAAMPPPPLLLELVPCDVTGSADNGFNIVEQLVVLVVAGGGCVLTLCQCSEGVFDSETKSPTVTSTNT